VSRRAIIENASFEENVPLALGCLEPEHALRVPETNRQLARAFGKVRMQSRERQALAGFHLRVIVSMFE
jgi:hypothetical protein